MNVLVIAPFNITDPIYYDFITRNGSLDIFLKSQQSMENVNIIIPPFNPNVTDLEKCIEYVNLLKGIDVALFVGKWNTCDSCILLNCVCRTYGIRRKIW